MPHEVTSACSRPRLLTSRGPVETTSTSAQHLPPTSAYTERPRRHLWSRCQTMLVFVVVGHHRCNHRDSSLGKACLSSASVIRHVTSACVPHLASDKESPTRASIRVVLARWNFEDMANTFVDSLAESVSKRYSRAWCCVDHVSSHVNSLLVVLISTRGPQEHHARNLMRLHRTHAS